MKASLPPIHNMPTHPPQYQWCRRHFHFSPNPRFLQAQLPVTLQPLAPPISWWVRSCYVDNRIMEKYISNQKRALLKPLLKMASIDGRAIEGPQNFPKAVITWIRNTGRNLTVWDHSHEAKDAFPEIRMVEMGVPDSRKL